MAVPTEWIDTGGSQSDAVGRVQGIAMRHFKVKSGRFVCFTSRDSHGEVQGSKSRPLYTCNAGDMEDSKIH